MNFLEIEKVIGREILDSRGNPTVEAEVTLADGTVGRGMAPSGASTGEFEALELRDGDKARYLGKGVTKAVENINTVINDTICGMDACDIYALDAAMIAADGTKDKSKLGANAILAVSIAAARAAAIAHGYPAVPFPWRNIRKQTSGSDDEHLKRRRTCSKHRGCAGVYDHAGRCSEALRRRSAGVQRYSMHWQHLLKSKGLATSVGDEGGFAPDLASDEEAIQYILEAVKKAGYEPGKDFMIAMDAASSEWKGEKKGEYILPKSRQQSLLPRS